MKRLILIFALIISLSSMVMAQEETPEPTSPDAPRPFLGIQFDPNDEAITIQVLPDSPADEAGLQDGDVITAINGEPVTVQTIRDVVNSFAVGETITVTITRDDESLDIDVTLGERPTEPQITLRTPPINMHGAFLGVRVNETDEGLVVDEVIEGSPAQAAGLQVGDILVAINDEDITTPESLITALLANIQEGQVTLTVERDGETLEITVELAPMMRFAGRMPRDFMPPFGEGDHNMPFGDGFEFRMPQQRIVLGVGYEIVDEGALITDVLPDSPAEAAGLMVGDIIQAVDGDVVDAERTLSDRLYAYEEGDTVTLDVLRDAETLQIEVTLAPVSRRAAFELPGTDM
ncbi:MAG: hypothetical protein CUN56_13615 [Phototrophicales bacterium]|nr:MAG: hypothetical protein CUN56_13615 [Phototrophicales bacterium]